MKNLLLKTTLVSLLSSGIYADDNAEMQALKAQLNELREITQTLIDETSDLKTGFNYTTVDPTQSYSGLSAAASKIYYSDSPLSIGGYGEIYYADKNLEDGASIRTLDLYRFIPYIGYKFSDNIILNTELEFEHGGVKNSDGTAEGGYVIVEFMYLDFLLNSNANIRVGHFLVPMGLINEKHEPTLFTTVQRPSTEKYLIPSTWHESGVMVYGEIMENLSYKAVAMSALETGVNGSTWIRDGRGGSFKQTNPSLAFVFRTDYTGINGLLVGLSGYYAPSYQGSDSNMLMADIHFDYKKDGGRLYGTYTEISRTDAKSIATDAVKKAQGGYINLSYDIASLGSSLNSMPLFIQYENYNPEASRVDGVSTDATEITTIGLNYFPHQQVVLKLDYAMQSDSDTTSISMGFIF